MSIVKRAWILPVSSSHVEPPPSIRRALTLAALDTLSSGEPYLSFKTSLRKLLHDSILLEMLSHLCSNFRCQIMKQTQVSPDWYLHHVAFPC
jgi:hypothetical protein